MTSGPAHPVVGRVLDAQGDPVSGAVVMFSEAAGPVQDVAVLTGPDGTFALAATVAGRYRIHVRGPGGEHAEVEVYVGADLPEETRIILGG